MTCKFIRTLVLGLVVLVPAAARAGDWPTYRRDIARSGISDERLGTSLKPDWVHVPTHAPSNAWSDPQPKAVEKVLELPKLRFDDAFHVAAVGDTVYFGSSSDCTVYALDARTGQVRWRVDTEGPVRMAPTVWKNKVYVGSDDGRAYCLAASDGKLIWRFDAAPSDRKVLGNGKMISLWPVRTGVTVDGGVAYFGAGIFPAEGLYLYAVDAESGKLLWKNDSYAQGGRSGISPQGYMLASKDKLFMPSGRAMPAGFARSDGRFLFHNNFTWREIGLFGGTYNVLAGDTLLNGAEQLAGIQTGDGKLAFTEGLRASVPTKGARRFAVDGDLLYMLTGDKAVVMHARSWMALRRVALLKPRLAKAKSYAERSKKQGGKKSEIDKLLKKVAELQEQLAATIEAQKQLETDMARIVRWQVPCAGSEAMILTQDVVIAGGHNVVVALDRKTGKQAWSVKVDGRARGLAVARERLLVSTDSGAIHCFSADATGGGRKVTPKIVRDPFGTGSMAKVYAGIAGRIVREGKIKRGYALLLGSEAQLAMELARCTELMIYLVQPDARKVAAARKALSTTKIGGARVVVLHAPLEAPPLADYFANLIVCQNANSQSRPATPPAELLRMLKPCGGVAFVGTPPEWGPYGGAAGPARPKVWLTELDKALKALGDKQTKVTPSGAWVKITRGPLTGAGSWTHQYGESGNTACGDDQLVRGSIGVLWFGEPGPGRMPSRHASNASPLAFGGRMFIQGENVIMAYDSYNGLELWKREIPGALRLGLKGRCSNLAANDDSLFAVVAGKCLRLDPATGKTVRSYSAPARAGGGAARAWQDYVACDGQTLYGSAGSCLFAVNVKTGRQLWAHEAKALMPITICLGDGAVFFVDRSTTPQQKAQALKAVPVKDRKDARGKTIKPDVRLVVSLDAATGKVKWTSPQYVSDCVKVSKTGGELIAMYANNVLLLCGQPWNGHFWREFFKGEFSRRSLIALSAHNGRNIWSGRKGYRSRPLVVGDTVIAEPWSYDLYTGNDRMRAHPVTGARQRWQFSRPGHHCGNIAAGPHALFFRSGVTAYYDLTGDYGTAHFGGQRMGCWINAIPADGLVLMPEASSGCVCPFSLHCTIVFQPRKTNRVWGMYSAPGKMTPVKALALNFGAPGDRKDSTGKLWLSWPRPGSTRLVLNFPVEVKASPGAKVRQIERGADFLTIPGTSDPWIYTFASEGMAGCAIPLTGPNDAPGVYTVSLHFAETGVGAVRGGRVFDVAIQGKTVLKDFDITAEAGGTNRAVVKTFKGVRVQDKLAITLTGRKGKTLLSGVSVTRQDN